MDSRTNPLAPNLVGDDKAEGETFGDDDPLKMDEGGQTPQAGALDTAFPDTSPTEDIRSDPGLMAGSRDPGLMAGSRDPDVLGSAEQDGRPDDGDGDTPYDAEGTAGSEGGR